jgi:hypothetical protein
MATLLRNGLRLLIASAVFAQGALAINASPAASQRHVNVSRQISCAACTISFRHIVNISDPAEPSAPAELFNIAQDSQGRIFVAPMSGNGSIGVYSRAGRLIRELGRPGGGPGEFRFVESVRVLRGDTVVAIDPAARRVTVFGPDLNLLDTYAVDFAPRTVIMTSSGAFIGYSDVGSGSTIYAVTNRGAQKQLILNAQVPADEPAARFRIVSAGSSGTIWVGRTNRYLVEQYSSGGRLLRTITSTPSWHEDWATHPTHGPDVERPVSILRAVREDDQQRLWLLFHVAKSDWRAQARPSRIEHPGGVKMTDWSNYVDTVVDVIDLSSGRLLQTRRFPGMFNSYLTGGENLFEARHEQSSGHVRISLWRLVLEGG